MEVSLNSAVCSTRDLIPRKWNDHLPSNLKILERFIGINQTSCSRVKNIRTVIQLICIQNLTDVFYVPCHWHIEIL